MSVDDLSARFQLVKGLQTELLNRVRDFRKTGDPSILPKASDADRLDTELEGIIKALDDTSDLSSEASISVPARKMRSRSSLRQFEVDRAESLTGRVTPPDISSSSSRSSSRSVTPDTRSVDPSRIPPKISPRRRRLESFVIRDTLKEEPTFMDVMKSVISNNLPDDSSIAESDEPAWASLSPDKAINVSLESLPTDGQENRQRLLSPQPDQTLESPKKEERNRSYGLPPIYTLLENPDGLNVQDEDLSPTEPGKLENPGGLNVQDEDVSPTEPGELENPGGLNVQDEDVSPTEPGKLENPGGLNVQDEDVSPTEPGKLENPGGLNVQDEDVSPTKPAKDDDEIYDITMEYEPPLKMTADENSISMPDLPLEEPHIDAESDPISLTTALTVNFPSPRSRRKGTVKPPDERQPDTALVSSRNKNIDSPTAADEGQRGSILEYISPTPPVSPPSQKIGSFFTSPKQAPPILVEEDKPRLAAQSNVDATPPSRRKVSSSVWLPPPPPATHSPREVFVPSSPLLKSNERRKHKSDAKSFWVYVRQERELVDEISETVNWILGTLEEVKADFNTNRVKPVGITGEYLFRTITQSDKPQEASIVTPPKELEPQEATPQVSTAYPVSTNTRRRRAGNATASHNEGWMDTLISDPLSLIKT
jgi:hypothetical protein